MYRQCVPVGPGPAARPSPGSIYLWFVCAHLCGLGWHLRSGSGCSNRQGKESGMLALSHAMSIGKFDTQDINIDRSIY